MTTPDVAAQEAKTRVRDAAEAFAELRGLMLDRDWSQRRARRHLERRVKARRKTAGASGR